MDQGELAKPSLIEQKFSTSFRVLKDQPTGEMFSVHEGLPKESYAGQGIFGVPNEPYVFNANHFELNVGGRNVVSAENARVLIMHGTVKDGNWVPLEQRLQDKGITVEQIVKAYESSSKQQIDAIFVCRPQVVGERVRISAFSGLYDSPHVFMKSGDAHGAVMINESTGEVTVKMEAESEDEVEFEKWKNKGRVKVII